MTLLVLLPLVALADPAILLQPTVATPTRVTVSGRVLKAAPTKGSSVVSRNLRRLASSNWEGAKVEISYAGQTTTTTSGHDGDFEVTLDAPTDHPFPVGPGVVQAHVRNASASAALEVLSPAAPYFVISDFDDTLAVTNVIHTASLVKAALNQDEATQPVVAGMADLYRCLRAVSDPAPAFMLVSGSPLQYLDRIQAFLSRHDFPPFGVALRDLGPNTLSDYKQPVIRALLARIPNKVVFIGDSGERDPEVYGQLRDEFPDRVAVIYIRNAGHAEDRSRFEGMQLFDDPKAALADAISKGLARPGCTGEEP